MAKTSGGNGRAGKDSAAAENGMHEDREDIVVVEEGIVEEPLDEMLAEAAPAADNGGKKDRFLPISIIIAAVLVGGAIVFATLYRPVGGAAPSGAPTAPSGPSATTTAALMQLGPRDAILGDANAPVTLIEYGDYQCPFCTRFFSQTQPQVVSNYVNAGKMRMVFRNFAFLGPESIAAAAAAECAIDQGKFWPYHNALYQAKVNDETNGGAENDGYFTRARFLSLAGQVGLNVADFTVCIDSNKYTALVSQEQQAAAAAGVNSTPTFFVNGTEILGAQPYAAFQSAIDAALKGS